MGYGPLIKWTNIQPLGPKFTTIYPIVDHSVPNLNRPARHLASDPFDVDSNGNPITSLTRFIRRPPAKNCSLPPGFPGYPPGWKRLLRICANLDRFSITCPADKACIECIPPWGGADRLVEWTNTFIEQEYDTRERRRAELQQIIDDHLHLRHDEA